MTENDNLELFAEYVRSCRLDNFSVNNIKLLAAYINELERLGYPEGELNTIAENELSCDKCFYDDNHDNRYCQNCGRDNLHCTDYYVHEE